MKKTLQKNFKFVALVWLGSFTAAAIIYFAIVSPQIQLKNQIASQFADKQKVYTTILSINNRESQDNLQRKMKQWQNDVGQYVITVEDLAGLTFDISQIAKD
jgi:capsular polysaccharide biosynthesis protein